MQRRKSVFMLEICYYIRILSSATADASATRSISNVFGSHATMRSYKKKRRW